jgi:integrase
MLSRAQEEGKLTNLPKLKNRSEVKRQLCLDDTAEALIFPHLEPNTRDALTIMRDVGARNSEVLAMRWENVIWSERTYSNPEGKSEAARRTMLLSDRVMDLLSARHVRQNTPRSGWIFPASEVQVDTWRISTTRASAPLVRNSESLLRLFRTQHGTTLGRKA